MSKDKKQFKRISIDIEELEEKHGKSFEENTTYGGEMTKEEQIKIIKEFEEKRIRFAFERSGYSHIESNYETFKAGYMMGLRRLG